MSNEQGSQVLAWHFTGDTLRNGAPIPEPGVTLRNYGGLVMCDRGLHASKQILDALDYAPGPLVHRVRLGGKVIEGDDKIVAEERTILWSIRDEKVMKRILCEFARWCALQVAHIWDAPQVVVEYLETGDGSKRDEAWNAVADAMVTINASDLEEAFIATLYAKNAEDSAARKLAIDASNAAWAASDTVRFFARIIAKNANGNADWMTQRIAQNKKLEVLVREAAGKNEENE